MWPGYSADSTSLGNNDGLVAELMAVLEQEEGALADLERLVAEKRAVLVASEPTPLLDMLPRVEEVLARIGQLEVARTGLVVRLPVGARDPSAQAHLLTIRHRILEAIARIAQLNEANAGLIARLSRVAGATIDRFSQMERATAFTPSPMARRGELWRRTTALDVQA